MIAEPTGGAHRNYQAVATSVKRALQDTHKQLRELSPTDLVERRLERLMSYGKFKEVQLD